MFQSKPFITLIALSVMVVISCEDHEKDSRPVDVVGILPKLASVCVNYNVQFYARLNDTVSQRIGWKVVSGYGTISDEGRFTAPSVLPDDSSQTLIIAYDLSDTNIRDTAIVMIYQNSPGTFVKSFQTWPVGSGSDRPFCRLTNGGYAMTGGMCISGDHFYISLFDSLGSDIRFINPGFEGGGYDIIQTSTGDIISTGIGVHEGTNKIVLTKTDMNGNNLNTFFYQYGIGYAIHETHNGDYIITGTNWNKIYVNRISNTGILLWAREYCQGYGHSVESSDDGSIYVTGEMRDTVTQMYQFGLLKINADGDTLWRKLYGQGAGKTCKILPDGNLMIAGIALSSNWDYCRMKVTPDGTVLWSKFFNKSGVEVLKRASPTNDNGFILIGRDESNGVWIVKTDQNGNEEWNRTYGLPGFNQGYAIMNIRDGRYVFTADFGGTSRNYFIRTDSLCRIKCLD